MEERWRSAPDRQKSNGHLRCVENTREVRWDRWDRWDVNQIVNYFGGLQVMEHEHGEAIARTIRERNPLPQRAPGSLAEREWFCRTCGVVERAAVVPDGWYTVERRDADRGRLRLGVYCSVDCIECQVPRLRAVEQSLARAAS